MTRRRLESNLGLSRASVRAAHLGVGLAMAAHAGACAYWRVKVLPPSHQMTKIESHDSDCVM